MPFRCKCGRTFEKVETFGSHTSGCAPFHNRKAESNNPRLSIQTSSLENKPSFLSPVYNKGDYFFGTSFLSSPTSSSPIFEGERFSFMMPTALSIQNTFQVVQRQRAMSYSDTAARSL